MNALNRLDELQFIQFNHDRLFHPDILCLPVQRRAAHMALHYAKYTGKLALANVTQDRELLISTLVDTFIISLASANIFNFRLAEVPEIAVLAQCPNISDMVKSLEGQLSDRMSGEDVFSYALTNMAIHSGHAAKAIESLDHLEDFNYKPALKSSIERIFITCLTAAKFTAIDYETSYIERLQKVEEKSIFYRNLRPEPLAHTGKKAKEDL